MPNYVTTKLTIESFGGLALAEIRSKFVNDKGLVDFDVIVPRPDCLKDFEPHTGIISRAEAALGLLPDPEKIDGNDLNALTKRMHLSNALRDATTKARDEDIPMVVRAIQNYKSADTRTGMTGAMRTGGQSGIAAASPMPATRPMPHPLSLKPRGAIRLT